jgi:LDH2 family malate/lactate/ureidoglycolate dehydrogenase
MDQWIRRFRAATPVSSQQPVIIPGDPEREMERERRQNGIPLHHDVIVDLNHLAGQLNIASIF